MVKICEFCGEEFEVPSNKRMQKYCSKDCYNEFAKIRKYDPETSTVNLKDTSRIEEAKPLMVLQAIRYSVQNTYRARSTYRCSYVFDVLIWLDQFDDWLEEWHLYAAYEEVSRLLERCSEGRMKLPKVELEAWQMVEDRLKELLPKGLLRDNKYTPTPIKPKPDNMKCCATCEYCHRSSRSRLIFECRNPKSEYYLSSLNTTKSGSIMNSVTWLGCTRFERVKDITKAQSRLTKEEYDRYKQIRSEHD